MTMTTRLRSKASGFFGKLLPTTLMVWMVGIAYVPMAQATVVVDQQPLIIQKPLAPNITLMLDDSGSMAWDYMPDACYLNGVVCDSASNYISTINNDAMINSSNNGVYYNPAITYTPPYRADGTLYPNAAGLTSAWVDGFNTSSGSYDLTSYGTTDVTGEANRDNDPLNYSTSVQSSVSNNASYTNVSRNTCNHNYNNTAGSYGGANYNSSTKTCTFTYYTYVTYNYFQYSTGPAVGPYVDYYVANSDCGGQSNCVLASDTSGTAAPSGVAAGQNIANWFSYYHTRILMAKSGLMNSFSTIDSTFRVGFGSIDGNNINGLPSSTYSYSDTYNNQTNYIANVQPFSDGSSGTQKNNFWNWLIGESAGGGTPLRQALDNVGKYYSSSQPWQTSATDSTELACRQSYTILTTDGFWNESTSSFTNPGNADGNNGTAVTGPNGQSYTYKAAAPYSDSNSNTLADVAMKYWETDLRPSDLNEVPPSTEDPAFWQHMSTFTLGLGFTPTGISPGGTTISQIFNWANGGTAISNFSWPKPSSNSIYNIADLAHAAVNGHGGFYSATSPQAFTSGLTDALKRAAERVGTGASLAANSTQLQTGTVAYQANYYTAKWKGDLKALAIDPTSGAIATTSTWTATSALPAAASRTIYTFNPQGGTGKQLVAFTSANVNLLSSAEQTALGTAATDQQNMINYLRGDSTLEQKNTGGIYRNRDTPFGDVVDSQPIFVGTPDPNQFNNETFSGSTSFVTYTSNSASRTPLIFVAANDGMLHMLNANTGAEVYAYIPGAVLANGGLTQLSNPSYGTTTAVPHQFFNDGELTVADVYYASAWHTVLVGTTGRGLAEAIYAFDVTDPTKIAFLWERSAGDGKTNSNYIGQMTGKPVIAQIADGSWSVLIGNGYNSAANVAALLQLDLSTGSLSVHQTADTSTGNGLAAPAAWIGNLSNGISTNAYAGDAKGQVWSFVLNDGTSSKPSSAGSLLFSAVDAGSKAQPITAGMLVGKDPVTSNVWLFFGTGRYLTAADLTVTDVQSWYGIIVQSTTASLVSNLSNGRSALNQRQIVAQVAATSTTSAARAITPQPAASDMTGISGWYLDLVPPTGVAAGERMVTPNQFQGNLLLGTTRIPLATDPCNPSGQGWVMAVDPFSGTAPTANFFDINGDGLINGSDMITVGGKTYVAAGVGFSSLPNNPIFVGSTMLMSFDNGTTGSLKTSGTTGGLQRVSWRELVNH